MRNDFTFLVFFRCLSFVPLIFSVELKFVVVAIKFSIVLILLDALQEMPELFTCYLFKRNIAVFPPDPHCLLSWNGFCIENRDVEN